MSFKHLRVLETCEGCFIELIFIRIGYANYYSYFYFQMNRPMIRAIFLDVDGTILSFNTHQVPASAQASLVELYNKGTKIIIATGRSFGNLAEISHIPYHGVVSLNGAECTLSDGKVVERHAISLEMFRKSMELAKEYDFAIAVEGNDGIFVDRIDSRVTELANMVALPLPEVRNLWDVFQEGVCSQLCFYLDYETEQKVMAQLPGLASSRWCDVFADVNVAGVDKAVGVHSFVKHLGIDISETMAFGDGGNDIPMLRAAGIGVAMGNASDNVKKHADYVTASVDEDGLYKAFRHFELI